jgi:ribosome-binding protein aMBF1 (putative translation factor)
MKKATLEEQFHYVINSYFGRELWRTGDDEEYEESMKPFIEDLARIAKHHKKGKSIIMHYFETNNNYIGTNFFMGKKIEKLRTQKGWTLAQLSEMTELNADYLRNIELGEPLLRLWELEQIAKAFKVKSSDILPF